ncbi:MAG: DUF3467 domain-containing protein [Bacteroidales bacterium]|jgi:hypothetical protein|nr:DUF3467 domain-containing protein [Bacteroidales bacterium]
MANNRNNQGPQDLKLDMSSDVANGTYSNLAIISHSPSEIILDFAQMLPGTPNATVRSRVIMNPIHAKRLLAALNDNIQKYERTFGTIVDPQSAINADTVPYDILGKA